MSPIFEFLFGQYSGYATIDIVLELVAVFFFLVLHLLFSPGAIAYGYFQQE